MRFVRHLPRRVRGAGAGITIRDGPRSVNGPGLTPDRAGQTFHTRHENIPSGASHMHVEIAVAQFRPAKGDRGSSLDRIERTFGRIKSLDPAPDVDNNMPMGGFALGTTPVVWTATDNSGNTATAMQMITIAPPAPGPLSLSAPAPVTMEADAPATMVMLGATRHIPLSFVDLDHAT